ncbi:MAG TPA: nuclear transport factor 2 family protein [Acidimicrobiia bacterium]|nr:nuclear transport factor 2 family protein [Acidimicrobiia bacterium]
MYMPSPYEAVLRKLVVAAADSKLAEAAPRLFADDAVLHVPGDSALAGDHHGPAAIADGYFRRQRDLADGDLSVEPIRMDVRDTRGVLVYDVRARRGAEVLEDRQVGVFRLGKGKIQEGWIECSDQERFDRFFS